MKKINYKINLLLYPLIQMFSFGIAIFFVESDLILSIIFVIIASLFMSFSLHISYHHHVHHRSKSAFINFLLDAIITVNLGLPFHFYKLQHLNHHKFDNEIGDMTSTYILKGKSAEAKSFFPYVFLWFLNIGNFKEYKNSATQDGYFTKDDNKKMIFERFLNLIVIITLFSLNWKFGLLFGTVFYVGWSIISLHNYGQHLPTSKHQIAYSYYGKLYNILFMNNGLHYEHHIYPQLNYWDLKKEMNRERTNKWIHSIDGFRYIFTKK